jgi:hypothetical protein
MVNLKLWIKNRLERLMVTPLMVQSELLKQSTLPPEKKKLQIIVPHRLNWKLTSATIRAFDRLTSGDFGITLVVNFDEIPSDWEGWKIPNLTIVKNSFAPIGRLYRNIFSSENGSMFNALALAKGLEAEPEFEWAFVAHNDSAPLIRGWNEHFVTALRGGLVAGNFRDRTRVFAAHSSGTLFHQGEFLKRCGTVWPSYRFGVMVWDVSDGITLALQRKNELVPVLPNSLQSPELAAQLGQTFQVLRKFVENGTTLSFASDERTPVFAHMGRGTPRSQQDPFFQHKLPVDHWIEWIDTLN